MDSKRSMVLQNVHSLFRLAREVVHENPHLAQRYVTVARKIAMRTRVRLPTEYRRLICKHCKRFIVPGINCRVRIQPRREPHLVVTCLVCTRYWRLPLRKRKNRR